MRSIVIVLVVVAACGGGGKPKPPPDAALPRVVIDAAPPVDATPIDPGVRSEGQVKRGDMIIKIFKRHGVGAEEGNAAIHAMKGHVDFRKLQPGQRYVVVQRAGKLLEFELELASGKVHVLRGADDTLTVSVD